MKNIYNPQSIPFLDQTPLVSSLIEIDVRSDEDDRIANKELDELKEFNIWLYKAKTSWGYIIIPQERYEQIYDDLSQKQDDLVARIEQLKQLPGSKSEIDKAKQLQVELNSEFDLYENAEPFKKTIFSWWLIPQWLEKKLIAKGETVLKGYGCSWWGITDPAIAHPVMSDVLNAIYEEGLLNRPVEPLMCSFPL